MRLLHLAFASFALLGLCACTGSDEGVEAPQPAAAIGANERLEFIGNEPFWGGHVTGTALVYGTPQDPAGTRVSVERFTGLGGVAFSGAIEGRTFDMAVSEALCSDTMSARTYPFTVTLLIGGEERRGCGWTERRPFVPQGPV